MTDQGLPPVPDCASFIGRQKFLEHLHSKIVQTEKSRKNKKPLQKMTVILGDGGIGKTSIALKYAQDYKKYHKNIAWINAETEQSAIESFLSLAKNLQVCSYILQKRTWTSDLSDLDVTCLVNGVYRHFSSRLDNKGLFIFDNVGCKFKIDNDGVDGGGDGGYFEIQKFLPTYEDTEAAFSAQSPCFLVTSKSSQSSWKKLVTSNQIIDLDEPLDAADSLNYLVKTLGVKSESGLDGHVRQNIATGIAVTKVGLLFLRRRLLAIPGLAISGYELFNMTEFEESARKLAKLLMGHPLALCLAKSKINVDWMGSGFSIFRYKVLNKLVLNYVTELESKLKNEDGGENLGFELVEQNVEDNYNFEKILNAVLTLTVHQMMDNDTVLDDGKRILIGNTDVSVLAQSLFNIISYLPGNEISVELCYMIYFNVCPSNDDYHESASASSSQTQLDKDRRAGVLAAFEILEQYGIVYLTSRSHDDTKSSVKLKEGDIKMDTIVARVQSPVQKWRRQYLEKNGQEGVNHHKKWLKIVESYFEENCTNSIFNSSQILKWIRRL